MCRFAQANAPACVLFMLVKLDVIDSVIGFWKKH